MAEKKELFADGLGQIHFAGGMVRLDFVTLQPVKDRPPEPQDCVRIILPPQGFIAAYTSMQQLFDKLVDSGMITRTPPPKGDAR